MATVVGVHGTWQQFELEEPLRRKWSDYLEPSLRGASFALAFYGDLFREPPGVPRPDELAAAELMELAQHDEALLDTAEPHRGVAADAFQNVLEGLCQTGWLARLAEGPLFARDWLRLCLDHVHRYLTDDWLRRRAQQKVKERIGTDTRVVLAHSLGSVVAYETLCAMSKQDPERTSRLALVTIGSPLGIPNFIFERLRPEPIRGQAAWPGVGSWTNLADRNDLVALRKSLRFRFPQEGKIAVEDILVDNRLDEHGLQAYLTAPQTIACLRALLG
jgi:hypothetical protein